MVTTQQIVGVSTATALAVLAGYAVYFDYRRRHDTEFRKALKRDKKRVMKAERAQQEAGAREQSKAIDAAWRAVQAEELPKRVESRESFFMQEVAKGETLIQQGAEYFVEAASRFYRALKIYPSPNDLLVIYENTLPLEVNQILQQFRQKDAQAATVADAPE